MERETVTTEKLLEYLGADPGERAMVESLRAFALESLEHIPDGAGKEALNEAVRRQVWTSYYTVRGLERNVPPAETPRPTPEFHTVAVIERDQDGGLPDLERTFTVREGGTLNVPFGFPEGYQPQDISISCNIHYQMDKENRCLTLFAITGDLTLTILYRKSVTEHIPVESIKINRSALSSMSKGQSVQLDVIFTPKNATDQRVLWSSLNTNVLTIDDSGLVYAAKVGSAIITATSVEGGHSSMITIRVSA